MTSIRPLHDRVLVRRVVGEEATEGGIIIPDMAKDRPDEGVVIAVGKGRRLDNGSVKPLDVEIGDMVYFSPYCGIDVEVDGEGFLIMNEDNILAVA